MNSQSPLPCSFENKILTHTHLSFSSLSFCKGALVFLSLLKGLMRNNVAQKYLLAQDLRVGRAFKGGLWQRNVDC